LSYRAGLLRCPACGEGLEPVAHGDETVDVCPACAGVWVDWFDGAIHDVARAVGSHRPRGVSSPAPHHTCPRCTVTLVHELAVAVAGSGLEQPWVERCGDCGGAFVPKASVGLFATTAAPEAPELAPEAGLWARLATALRDLFGSGR
jgi:Zn-finger nucleic acid-binding protein